MHNCQRRFESYLKRKKPKMNKYFKVLETHERIDLLEYVIDRLQENPHLKIYVGTDSQNYGGFTHYAIAVVLRYNQRGGHVLYQKLKVPRIRDHWSRLWKECELSLEVAEWLRENSAINIEAVELDYNTEKITESHKLVSATRGWVESLGYKAKLKPDEMIACKAADHIARR